MFAGCLNGEGSSLTELLLYYRTNSSEAFFNSDQFELTSAAWTELNSEIIF